jgi:hypothetical protein
MAKVTVLTNVGEEWAAGRLAGTVTTDGKYLGWGTGTGTAAKGDTTLATEASENRVSGVVSVEGSAASAKYQVEGTITADAAKTITNAGNFSASTSGTLILHSSFDGLVLSEGDTLTLTFTLNPS